MRVELTYKEATKKSQGDDYNEMSENAILLAQPNQPHRCPVAPFKYLPKLAKIPDLFHQPYPQPNSPVARGKLPTWVPGKSHTLPLDGRTN